MEVRARYILMGLFTLAAIAAGFLFVYWLEAPGRVGQRAVYRIHFQGPVSGLLKGSAVLFNGVRVGEVTALAIDAADPNGVMSEIAVSHQTPVRADTKVSIEFQGLTGAPAVALSGGTAALPLLGTKGTEAPLLTADKNAGQSMTQSATEVLRRLDGILSENQGSLKSAVASVDKFAGALARNSDKVDGIVAGLERLTGGGAKVVPVIAELAAAQTFAGLQKRPTVQLLIPDPSMIGGLDSEKVQIVSTGGERKSLDGVQWPDSLPKVVQARLIQSFENAQYMLAVGRGPDGLQADFQLLLDVRNFSVQAGDAPNADVQISARIVNPAGKIVGARVFRKTVPETGLDAVSVIRAFNGAFEAVASEIVVWTCGAI